MQSIRLIGKQEQGLPSDVQIKYKGEVVSRLTITKIWVWNNGKETIYGNRVVEDDPLRYRFDSDTQILQIYVLAGSRTVNKFNANISPNKKNEFLYTFDFLDPRDGALIEILHTNVNALTNVTYKAGLC